MKMTYNGCGLSIVDELQRKPSCGRPFYFPMYVFTNNDFIIITEEHNNNTIFISIIITKMLLIRRILFQSIRSLCRLLRN